jgi:NADP-dependent 3-hydroxy acid dehydrogenase YdfG
VAAAQRVQDELDGADVLVNNAGIMLLGPFVSEQREDSRRTVETNLLGAMTDTEVFLDQLKDGGGDLVNISSVAGRTARAGNAGYAATKWGMNGWSESLRQELQPDVRVIVVEPGAVATELPDHITHGETKQAVKQGYAQLSITAQDIAEIIAFAVTRPRSVSLNRSSCGRRRRPCDARGPVERDAPTRVPATRREQRRRGGRCAAERLRPHFAE